MSTYIYAPIVVPYASFNAEEDAQELRSAMKGLGTNEKVIIDILAFRSNEQRQIISREYKTLFGRDLVQDLKSELKGNFEDVVVALMTPTYEFLAKSVNKAISGAGTNESALIEILCPLTNQEVVHLNAAYQKLYKKSLEKALSEETSGHFKRLLVALSVGNRDEDRNIDDGRAHETAQVLFEVGEKKLGTDESIFLSIFAKDSFPQLVATFRAYEHLSKKTLLDVIKSEMSGDLCDGFVALVKCAENTSRFFAERLYEAMKGLGTDDESLIRIVVSRSEMDMKLIKETYYKIYDKHLQDAISGDTSGDYKKILIALITE